MGDGEAREASGHEHVGVVRQQGERRVRTQPTRLVLQTHGTETEAAVGDFKGGGGSTALSNYSQGGEERVWSSCWRKEETKEKQRESPDRLQQGCPSVSEVPSGNSSEYTPWRSAALP